MKEVASIVHLQHFRRERFPEFNTLSNPAHGVAFGGAGGQMPPMDERIAELERQAKASREQLSAITATLKEVSEKIDQLPSKQDVKEAKSAAWNALGIGAAVSASVLAIFVGLLAYLQDQRISLRAENPPNPPMTPLILQLPPWPAPPAVTPTPGNATDPEKPPG